MTDGPWRAVDEWYRDHGEPGDGERYLAQMFRHHWGRHLRDLQSFLHRFVFGG